MGTKKLLVDTNILLDYCDTNRPEHESARLLVEKAAEDSSVSLVASIGSYKDAYYILRRLYRSEPEARHVIARLMDDAGIEPVDLLARYGKEAIASNEPDFENGLIRASAENESVAAIISRDSEAFSHSPVQCMDAGEALKKFF